MSRDELIERLGRMVGRGKITTAEAGRILRLFDEGRLRDVDLALESALSAPATVTAALAAEAARASVAGRVLLRRISLDGRRRLTIRLMEEFDENVFDIVRSFTRGQSGVRSLHSALLREVTNDLLREATLGAGRDLLPSEIAVLRARIDRQAAFLQRFMDEVAFRDIAGRPFSEKYILQRISQYKGEGLGAFYDFSEREFSDDYVFDYIPVDDGGTCSPCHQAGQGSPYLRGQGPIPGVVCVARGKCRCRREPRYAPEEARALRGG